MKALIGKYNLNVEDEFGSVNSLVWEIKIHPDWNFNNQSYDADLSIIVLEKTVMFSDYIQPICLPKQSDNYVSGIGTVVGWGKSENSGIKLHDTTPSQLEVPAVEAEYCYPRYPKLAGYSSRRMFCGGYENQGKAPCLGDSGGGFYRRNSPPNRFYTIIGIVWDHS